MPRRRDSKAVATLWRLAWNGDQLSCVVYKAPAGLEMRLECGGRTLLKEAFELGPRMIGRTAALRSSLKRRGWADLPRQSSPPASEEKP